MSKKSPSLSAFPSTAMVLAAGLGTRMRAVTDQLPKPLVEVAGRTLLDRALDRLERAGIKKVVVNVHYMADKVEAHLEGRNSPEIVLSDETGELLETGGGVAKALPHLGGGPFFVINSDCIWRDAMADSLHQMAAFWDDEKMDALLLMMPTVAAHGYDGYGDFNMAADGKLARRPDRELTPFLFTGVQLLHPRLFEGRPEGGFSLNRLYDKAAETGRLYGLRHEGDWMHVGSPDGLAEAERLLTEAG